MSLEQKIDELNTNIQGLIKILEVYPSPIDEATDKPTPAKAKPTAKPKQEAPAEDSKGEVEPEHTHDDLATIAREVLQADKSKSKQIKAKLDELGIEKVTLTPHEHLDDVYEFIKGLK